MFIQVDKETLINLLIKLSELFEAQKDINDFCASNNINFKVTTYWAIQLECENERWPVLYSKNNKVICFNTLKDANNKRGLAQNSRTDCYDSIVKIYKRVINIDDKEIEILC